MLHNLPFNTVIPKYFFSFQPLGICSKGFRIGADFLHELWRWEGYPICKISLVNFYSEVNASVLPFLKGNSKGLKTNRHAHTRARARTHTHTHRHRRVLCDFCGIFKNTYFVEHLQGTTSHFMTYWNKCRVPESVIRFNYGNLVFKTICSNVLITLKINVHRLNHK